MKTVGVLAFHGDVTEHLAATRAAAKKLKLKLAVIPVRSLPELKQVGALIIPGGESTTLFKLCREAGMWPLMRKLPAIFGTCAGAILLAKKVLHKEAGQESLGLIDMIIDRNAYGRQTESFVEPVSTQLGKIEAVFIRAPKIKSVGKTVKILAKNQVEIIACQQRVGKHFYLAACFHPELTTTKWHEYFLKQIYGH